MKFLSVRLLRFVSILFIFVISCSERDIDSDKLQHRGDGLYYAVNEEEPYSGKVHSTYNNVQILNVSAYKNGKLHGLSSRWYRNGQKQEEGTYKDGKKDGQFVSWYDNGHKIEEGIYKDGKKDGQFVYWYNEGQKAEEIIYKDGMENGQFLSWDVNGQKMKEGAKKNDALHGLSTIWYRNGQKQEEGTYKDGKKDGQFIYWYDNGQIEKEGKMINGIREGQWNFLARDGRKLVEILSDSFNDNSFNWYEINNNEMTTIIQAGRYEFENKKDQAMTSYKPFKKIKIESFIIEVDVTHLYGVQTYGYGIIMGIDQNAYSSPRFLISADGGYLINQMNWKESEYIKTGNMTNTIMIKQTKNKAEIYINGHLIETPTNNDSFGNDIGFIGFYVENKQKIGFDNISILQ
ncbi:MAG: toxin-antitoxin system YwqK family antitoxin [Methylococcales bacterium]